MARVRVRSTLFAVVLLSAAACSSPEPQYPPDLSVQDIHERILAWLDHEFDAVLVVNPETPEPTGSPPRPMSDEAIEHFRDRGMERLDRELAQALAKSIAGEMHTAPRWEVEGVIPWDGTPEQLAPSGDRDFYRLEDGREAVFVQLYPVGFSADHLWGLTFVDVSCGDSECGTGFLVLASFIGDWGVEMMLPDWQG